MKEVLYKVLSKDMESIHRNRQFIKDTLLIMYLKGRVLWTMLIIVDIKECGKMVTCQGKEYFIGLMVVGMKERINKD